MPIKIFTAVIVNLVFWEVLLRCFIATPSSQLYDDELGYVNIPYARYIHSTEGYSITKYNSLGFNDNEPSLSNRKIFIIGDSYTEAAQVKIDDNYAQLLETNLNMTLRQNPVDIINLGRAAFIPVHYPILMKRFFDRFKPELIVLQFAPHSGGDLYSSQVIAKYENNKLVALDSAHRIEDKQKESYRSILNNSALLFYIVKKYKGAIMKYMTNKPMPDELNKRVVATTHRSVDDMEDRFGFLLDKIMKHGARIVIIYLPEPGFYMITKDEKDAQTLEALKRISAKKNIPIYDFSYDFQDYYNRHRIPLNGFINSLPGTGHLNSYGHELVGAKLSNFLLPLIN